jgi:hypothetical protein
MHVVFSGGHKKTAHGERGGKPMRCSKQENLFIREMILSWTVLSENVQKDLGLFSCYGNKKTAHRKRGGIFGHLDSAL